MKERKKERIKLQKYNDIKNIERKKERIDLLKYRKTD